MKICGYCGAENEISYLYCVNCNNDLPKQEKIDKMLSLAQKHLDNGEFRAAYRQCDKILKLNVGSAESWFFRAISARKLRMAEHAKDCFTNAGVEFDLVTCPECRGRSLCVHCGDEGKCFMCRGVGNCSICRGNGTCDYCSGDASNCAVCKGTGQCPSCKGNSECPECGGAGSCKYCKGTRECHVCGGTRKAAVVKEEGIPAELRKYLNI